LEGGGASPVQPSTIRLILLFNMSDIAHLQVLASKDVKKKPIFIGVTGSTASGKTTICKQII